MLVYLARRLLAAIPVIIGVTLVVFLMIHIMPGDPAQMVAGFDAPKEQVEKIRTDLGLDKPLYVQYVRYMSGLLKGDLGRSLHTRRPVLADLMERFPATLELTLVSIIIAIIFGIPIGILSAVKRYSLADHTAMTVALFGLSMPIFWTGIMLMFIFSLYFGVLPVSGRGGVFYTLSGLRHLILPSITLALAPLAMIARLTRSSVLEVMKLDYVIVARSKGLNEGTVLVKHVLRNALIPVVTFVGLQFGALLGGAVVTESIFAWPGIGRFLLTSIQGRDYPAIQGTILMIAVVFVFVNIVVDFLYGVLDPRIRLKG